MYKKLTSVKSMKMLFMLCWVLYFTAYLTRINYSASVAELASAENIARSAAGLIGTGSFIAYAIGQIVSGLLGDKFNPYKLIFFGICCTSLANLLFSFSESLVLMIVLWSFNGFAQAFLWPPLVRLMAEFFPINYFKKSCVNISIACALSTITVYLLSPVCITLGSWRTCFRVSSAVGFTFSVIWLIFVPRITSKAVYVEPDEVGSKRPESVTNKELAGIFVSSGMLTILGAIVLQGILRDGVQTWIPSMISETYSLTTSLSILITVTLPIFTVIALKITDYINRRFFNDEVKCSLVLFGAATFFALLLTLLSGISVVITVGLSALVVGCMHGINLMLIAALPSRFESCGRIATASGILNTFTYVGSAASTYGIALISEKLGWSATVISWIIISLLGVVLLLFTIPKWKKFIVK